MNIFERASRMKLRFDFKGNSTVEDLWQLSVEELDGIYVELRKTQQEAAGESLLSKVNEADRKLALQIEIVKHIVTSKLASAEAAKTRAENKMRRDRIAAILADKKDEKLKGMSEEELQAELESFSSEEEDL